MQPQAAHERKIHHRRCSCGNDAALPRSLRRSSATGNSDQAPSAAGNAGGTVEIIPSTDRGSSPDVPANEDSAADDAWKAAFEKSLLENYGVKPDHYEELENGVYQVYVEIDGKVVPYVAVDSATGDYHG